LYEKLPAAVAFNVRLEPKQIPTSGPAFTAGVGYMVMF